MLKLTVLVALAILLVVAVIIAVVRWATSNKSLARVQRSKSWVENAADMSTRFGKRAPDRALAIGLLEGSGRQLQMRGVDQHEQPVDAATIFEIGSVSKTFTGLLLADAVVREEVLLESTLGDILGRLSLSRSAAEITLGQLATHTSGLPRLPSDIQAGSDKHNPYAHYTRGLLLASLGEIDVLR